MARATLGIGVIGFGLWGPRLAAALAESPGSRIAAIADVDPGRLAPARKSFPDAFTTSRTEELLQCPDVAAVVIATPPGTHFELARAALGAGRHVLVEKPLANNVRHCRELIRRARQQRCVLAVDHTMLYDEAVPRIRGLVQRGALGAIHSYDAVRITAGPLTPDCDVAWDLAVHDLAIMDYVLPLRPIALSAVAFGPLRNRQRSEAAITLRLNDDALARIHVRWLASVRRRRTTIIGSRRTLVFDELETAARLQLVDNATGHTRLIRADGQSPLTALARDFVRAIRHGKPPTAGGVAGERVVRMLEAAEQSIARRGALIPLRITE